MYLPKAATKVSGAALLHSHLAEPLCTSKFFCGVQDVFTPFRTKVESKGTVRPPAAAPKAGHLPLPQGIPVTGGAQWDLLPLAPDVKSDGPPKAHANAVLDFQARPLAAAGGTMRMPACAGCGD